MELNSGKRSGGQQIEERIEGRNVSWHLVVCKYKVRHSRRATHPFLSSYHHNTLPAMSIVVPGITKLDLPPVEEYRQRKVALISGMFAWSYSPARQVLNRE